MNLDPKLLSDFSRHISVEMGNSVAYLSLYSFLRANGWEGFSRMVKDNAIEEAEDAQTFTKFCARHNDVVMVEVDEVKVPADLDVAKAFSLASGLEDSTETSMRALVKIAKEVEDDDAVEWVSGQLMKQAKEAKRWRDIADQIAELDESGLVIMNREVEKNGWRK
jgi:ferritin